MSKNELNKNKGKEKAVVAKNSQLITTKKKSNNNTYDEKKFKDWKEKRRKEEEEYKKNFPYESDDTPQNPFFNKIVKLNQNELKTFCEKELQKRGYSSIKNRNGFLYAKGEVPVLLVAHLDTVHAETVKEIYYNKGRVYSPQGIGGDDRCGIYMILKIVQKHKCHVLFTEDEEIGCVGANKFTKTTQFMNMPVNYIIEFDRKNKNDAVFYNCSNYDFIDFIIENDEGFFKEAYGSFSDICDIAPYLGVAAVNLSCGYYEAHTTKEYVVLNEMETIISEAKKIITKPIEKPFVYIEKPVSYATGYGKDWYDYYDDYYDDYYGYGSTQKKEIDSGEVTGDEDEYGNVYMFQDRICTQEKIFHLLFICKETGWEKVAEICAVTEYEAIGMFLNQCPNYTRNDIVEVKQFK